MSDQAQLAERFTDVMAKFTAFFGKRLPDDVLEKLEAMRRVQKSELATLVYDGENVTVTIPAWAEKNAAISAAFAQIQRSDVSFKVTVTDALLSQQPNVADVNVYLVSERTGAEIKANPEADGTVKFGQLPNGKYTLRIDGARYPTYTVEVGGTLEGTYAFDRTILEEVEGVSIEGNEVTLSKDDLAAQVYYDVAAAQVYYDVAANADFMLTAAVSEFAANSANDAIVGLYAMTGAGDAVGNTGGTVNKVMGGIYLKADGVYLQFVGTEQSGVKLPEAYQVLSSPAFPGKFQLPFG